MTPLAVVSDAIVRFLLSTHAHPLTQDPVRPWLRRPDPGACPECQVLADALDREGGGR